MDKTGERFLNIQNATEAPLPQNVAYTLHIIIHQGRIQILKVLKVCKKK